MAILNQKEGYDNMGPEMASQLVVGYHDLEVVNVTNGDVVPTMKNCRFIKVDTAGVVKIDIAKKNGEATTEVLYLPAGILHKCRNVEKVYTLYAAQTSVTGKVYTDAGVSVIGLKLLR